MSRQLEVTLGRPADLGEHLAEGACLESFPHGGGFFLNELEGLIVHEIGHTLGIDHSSVASA